MFQRESREVPKDEPTDDILSHPWNHLDYSSLAKKRKHFQEEESSLQDSGSVASILQTSDLQHEPEEYDSPTILSLSSIMCSSTPKILASQTQQVQVYYVFDVQDTKYQSVATHEPRRGTFALSTS